MNLVKIVISIFMKEGLGGKLMAKKLEKAITGSLAGVGSHPAISHIESRVEP